jgi:SAM-dependent methyltransferase
LSGVSRAVGFVAAAVCAAALAQAPEKAFEPVVGQPGKDVVWVPTPRELVEKMLDMARVTSADYVMDLGSGDGRMVIAAAKRGARARGVEYDPQMVALARRAAAAEGVADRASFVQGDMYEADISQATVLALFLLPDNLRRLTPKFLALKPGSRIVSNGFPIEGWQAEELDTLPACYDWCTALLYVVPAKVAGTWRLPQGTLRLRQDFQRLSGELVSAEARTELANPTLSGERIGFTIGLTRFTGRVRGDVMSGDASGAYHGQWEAIRIGHDH